METVFTKADELVGTVKEYVNARVDLLKLEAAEKSAGMVAGMMARIAVAVVFLCFFVFAGIGLSLLAAEYTGNTWSGYLIVAFVYLLIGIIAWMGRSWMLRTPMMNAMIKEMFKNDEED